MPRALVVGGTGPTGPYVVNGLRQRGYTTTILHTGKHEIDEIPADVEHLHTSPHDPAAFQSTIGDRTYDVTIVMYGRLRAIAEIMQGRTGQFISVGGVLYSYRIPRESDRLLRKRHSSCAKKSS